VKSVASRTYLRAFAFIGGCKHTRRVPDRYRRTGQSLHNMATMVRVDLTFLAGQRVMRCTHRIDKHFRDYSTLQFCAAGRVRLQIDGRPYGLNGRWFWSAWDGPRVAFAPAEPGGTWQHRYIAFRGPRVRQWMDSGLFPILPQPAPPAGRWAERFDQLLEQSRRARRWAQLRATNILEGILIELAEARDQPPAPGPMEQVRTMLRSALDREIDYTSLASRAGMSPRTLRRAFRQQFGTSPHQYLIESRIARARELLAETDLPIKQIAQSLGYMDVFYFGRQFRAHAGVPPAAYRRSREA
jgi:AraC-like DNA-binding protein